MLAVILLIAVAAGAVGHPAWMVPALLGIAAVAGVAWLLTARSAADPVLPLRLFRDSAVAIPTGVSFLIGFALFGTISYLRPGPGWL